MDMESTGISREQADLETKPAGKASFWRGFGAALLLGCLILGYLGWREFRWYWGHTEPTKQEVGKLSALFNMGPDREFKLVKYEFQYYPIGMDKMGSTAFALERTANSPSWDDMLTSWTRLEKKPDDFNRIFFRPWVKFGSHQGPIYYRWVSISFADNEPKDVYSTGLRPQLCVAFFPADTPERLYGSVEGELMLPNANLIPAEPEGLLDWSKLPWAK